MKIAVYFDLPPGGASRTMEELTKILGASHEILIYHNIPPLFSLPFLTRLLADLESVLFQRFKQHRQAKEIDKQKFDLVLVSHDRHSQSPWILRFLKTPTVFLCQEPTRAYFEEFLKIDSKLPLLNKVYETLNRTIRKNIEIKNASFATRIIANSNYSTESIFRAYGRHSTPIYLGIDPLDYYPEAAPKKNCILVIGNNEPQKAIPFAIEVISKIPEKARPKLLIVSPRERDSSELKQLAKKLGVRLEIIIGLNQDELRAVYSQSLLTLAVAYLEPFGLSVIESLACGTPVVAVSEGGFRETVRPGDTGLLVERDPRKIALEVLTLLRNRSLMAHMGSAGVKDVNRRFTWQQTVRKIEEIFYETSHHHR